jgi:integrase
MYTDGQERAKVGRVSVDIKGKSYRLRFTYPEGERHEFSIARVSTEGWSTALRAAQLINRDIDLGDFDSTYARYSPKHAKSFQIAKEEAKKEYSLKELWEMYKNVKVKTVSESTIKKDWSRVDKLFEILPSSFLALNKAEEAIEFLLTKYTPGTLNPLFRVLYAAINMQVKKTTIPINPYLHIYSPYQKKSKKPECFETKEVKAIILAFNANTFNPKDSPYCHSYYAPMVEFLALTGCRPSEVHAVTWEDIKVSNGKTFIRFNKVWTSKILLPYTKTHEIRLFPCNDQLVELLGRIPKRGNLANLIFPSVKGGYVTQSNFNKRYWKPIVNGLVGEGRVNKYLKPYCLRHSFITRLVREGVDIATVASLSGNSPEIIMRNYLASRQDFDLPEL